MELTHLEEKERQILIAHQSSITRLMSQFEQDRLKYLNKKEFHNNCSNIHCLGFEGKEHYKYCPLCGSKLHKLI